MGGNNVRQDLASQLLTGGRASLAVAIAAGGIAAAVGTLIGVLAAWLGRWADLLVMRAVDLALIVPRLPLLILLGAYTGAHGWARQSPSQPSRGPGLPASSECAPWASVRAATFALLSASMRPMRTGRR